MFIELYRLESAFLSAEKSFDDKYWLRHSFYLLYIAAKNNGIDFYDAVLMYKNSSEMVDLLVKLFLPDNQVCNVVAFINENKTDFKNDSSLYFTLQILEEWCERILNEKFSARC